jgi:DNA-binding MarR family transcriptional regulator
MTKGKPEPTPYTLPIGATPPCLYLRLRLASRRLLALYEARLAPSGVSMSQFGILTAAAQEPKLTMSRMAEMRELSPSTLTRTLQPLEDAGWVATYADEGNRRIRRVELTKEGRAKLKAAYACWKQAQAEAEEILSAKAVEQVLRATEKLAL